MQMLFANLFCNLCDLSYLCDINIVGMQAEYSHM